MEQQKELCDRLIVRVDTHDQRIHELFGAHEEIRLRQAVLEERQQHHNAELSSVTDRIAAMAESLAEFKERSLMEQRRLLQSVIGFGLSGVGAVLWWWVTEGAK